MPHGLAAGVGNLFTFEAVFLANMNISAPGQVTFNFFSDDGWILGLGPQPGGGNQPTYVSGELSNPPASTPVNAYPVVGALNGPSAPTQAQVTVNFPAAGSYPLEVDYTECCGGQLALTLGSTAGNPILPGCSTAPASTDWQGVFSAEICQISQYEGGIAQDQASLLGIAGQFPNVVSTGTNTWMAPLGALVGVQSVAAAGGDVTDEAVKVKKITDLVARILAQKLTNTPSCAGSVAGSLVNAATDNAAAAIESAKAGEAMGYALANPTGTTLQEIVSYLGKAEGDFITKWGDLTKALIQLGAACESQLVSPTVLESSLSSVEGSLAADANTIASAETGIALVPSGGYLVTGTQNGLITTISPQLWPLSTSQYPAGVPPTGQIIPSSLSEPLNVGNVTSVTQTGSVSESGSGFLSGSPISAIIGSLPVRLATVAANASGSFATSVKIPVGISAGLHELEAIGTAPDGSLRVLGTSITVKALPGLVPSRICIGTVSGTFNAGLEVPAGASCTLDHGTVNGQVTVDKGAVFEADSSTVNGGIVANSPTAVALCGDQVNGDVSVQSSAIPALIGSSDSPFCATTTITGGIINSLIIAKGP